MFEQFLFNSESTTTAGTTETTSTTTGGTTEVPTTTGVVQEGTSSEDNSTDGSHEVSSTQGNKI